MASKQTPVHQSELDKEIQEPVQDPVYFEDAGDKVDVRSILKIARGEELDAAAEPGDSPEKENPAVTIKAVQSSPEPRKRKEQSDGPDDSISGTGTAKRMDMSRDAYMDSLPLKEKLRRRVSEALHSREEAAEARRMRSHMVRAAKHYGVELSEEDLKAPEPARPEKRESHEVIERQVSRERAEKVRSRLEERQTAVPEKTAAQTANEKADPAREAATEKAKAEKAAKAAAEAEAAAAAQKAAKAWAAEAERAAKAAAEAEAAAAAQKTAGKAAEARAAEAEQAAKAAAEAEAAAAAEKAARARAAEAEQAAKAAAEAEAAAAAEKTARARAAEAEQAARAAAEAEAAAAAQKAAKEADERDAVILRREQLEEFRRQQEYNARVLQRYREDAPDQVDRMLGRYGLSKEATVRLATLFLIAVLSVIYVMGRNKQPDLIDVPVAGEGMTGAPAVTDTGSGTGAEEETGGSENTVESESENTEP